MSSTSSHLSILSNFVQTHLSHLRLVTPNSREYGSLRPSFSLSDTAAPLAIICPYYTSDVSSLISFTTAHHIPVTVRSGGYSYFGAAFAQGALALDLRSLSHIQLYPCHQYAVVGGGVLQGDLARNLAEHGLMTPLAGYSSMGYVGWATYGGYGPFSAYYGLGVDQIVGAKLVDSEGHVRDSDTEGEEGLLRAIRGSGGALGVIAELRIRVYPLKKVLAGNLVFGSKDIPRAVEAFNNRFRELSDHGLPPQLSLKQVTFTNSRKKYFGVEFMWACEDIDIGRQWLSTIETIAPVSRNEVVVTTIPQWMDSNSRGPSNGYGQPLTLNVRRLTPEIVALISKYARKMTDNCLGFSVHELRGNSAAPDLTSVFGAREPHFMFEIAPIVSRAGDLAESERWAQRFITELKHTDPSNILPGTYISLTRHTDVSLSNIYGPNFGNLLELKWMYDPNDIFNLAVPQLIDNNM
ncbi:D-lactate dehydrogenase protein [Rutstroemia sp. NJR-2017a BBW]|nr:D-lactate dehydrogenase protein [Rutstroemia sp. NJR-2017a BBW]